MLRTPSGQILFRFMGKEEAKACVQTLSERYRAHQADPRCPPRRMSSMDSEEKLVLDHIKEAGNMGACRSLRLLRALLTMLCALQESGAGR